jgi:hypothetical protein
MNKEIELSLIKQSIKTSVLTLIIAYLLACFLRWEILSIIGAEQALTRLYLLFAAGFGYIAGIFINDKREGW